jgi:hypothetical protein
MEFAPPEVFALPMPQPLQYTLWAISVRLLGCRNLSHVITNVQAVKQKLLPVNWNDE